MPTEKPPLLSSSPSPTGKALRILSNLKPRWAWATLAAGLPFLLVRPHVHGCGGALLWLFSLPFWVGLVALALAGALWLWRRLLFKVSRRLWTILILVFVLPGLAFIVLFLSIGWLGLGAQANRSFQGNLQNFETALRQAAQEPQDPLALQSLQPMGGGWIKTAQALPKGITPKFVGLVYDTGPQAGNGPIPCLRAVTDQKGGYRLLNMDLNRLTSSGRSLWGGRVHYRLEWAGVNPSGALAETRSHSAGERKPAVTAWIEGEASRTTGLLSPFKLPAVSLRVLDWRTGQPMLLTATPETSLYDLYLGFASGRDQGALSGEALEAILVVGLLVLGLGILQVITLLMGLVLARQLGGSVDSLAKGVGRLSLGDFSVRIRPRTRDQVGELTRAFNDMARRLEQADVERCAALRMEEELKLAREVQMRLLPDLERLRLPGAVHASILPAREVAGDYYDVLRLQDGSVAFLIADVSGKGTSAAFYAAETKGVLAALDKVRLGPREVAERINEIWWESHPRSLFMTLAYGRFDPHSGVFSFIRAGHPPAFLRRADATVERLLPRGMGVGLSLDRFLPGLELCEGRLEPGDALVFFTDGLTEAQDCQGAFYGEERLRLLLGGPCLDLPVGLLADVKVFTGEEPLQDDLTLLVLRRG
jgi:serine phosphatase RsbU (regulator of sigma subunit)